MFGMSTTHDPHALLLRVSDVEMWPMKSSSWDVETSGVVVFKKTEWLVAGKREIRQWNPNERCPCFARVKWVKQTLWLNRFGSRRKHCLQSSE